MDVEIMEIASLRQHEMTDPENLRIVLRQIRKSGVFKEPIIVDKENLVVLDGHHRLNSCIELGLRKIPCLLVDYLGDKQIRVSSRRKEFEISKQAVVERAKNKMLFPHKTTRHFIPGRARKMRIPLDQLV